MGNLLTAQSTPTEVGDAVASIGGKYEKYRADAVGDGINGVTALSMTDKDLKECGVKKRVHRDRILEEISKAKAAAARGGGGLPHPPLRRRRAQQVAMAAAAVARRAGRSCGRGWGRRLR
jgi:hypothetical protein